MATVMQLCLVLYASAHIISDVSSSQDGLYRNSAHYFKIDSNKLIDTFAASKRTVFPTKLNVVDTNQLGKVISLNSQDYYVNIKGFEKECVTDPNVCPGGLSVAFWLQMFSGKHIISGGRYRDEQRGSGFVILHDSNSSQFRIEIVTSRKKWTAVLHKIPFTKQWFHLVFTWSEATGLRVYINGQFVIQKIGAQEWKDSLRSLYEDNGILIGGKDPSSGKIENVSFKIGHLAVWEFPLDALEIKIAYKKWIKKTALSIKCCNHSSVNKCVTNVCYKFREPEHCAAFFKSKTCLCQDDFVQEKCKSHAYEGPCKDKRADCKALASQTGYCEYYQQEMEELCPLSCQFCNLSASEQFQDETGKYEKNLNLSQRINEAKATAGDLKARYFTMLPENPTEAPTQEAEKRESAEIDYGKRELSNKDNNNSTLRLSKDETENSPGAKIGGNDKANSTAVTSNHLNGRKSSKLSKEVLVFALIGCAAGIILLFLISLYSWKVYRRKKWMKWSTYFVTVIPRDQSDGRLQGKDEIEQ